MSDRCVWELDLPSSDVPLLSVSAADITGPPGYFSLFLFVFPSHLFRIFSGDGAECLFVCSWDGIVNCISQQKDINRFRFMDRPRAFRASSFSLIAGRPVPCYVFATFFDQLIVYHNLLTPSVKSFNLLSYLDLTFNHSASSSSAGSAAMFSAPVSLEETLLRTVGVQLTNPRGPASHQERSKALIRSLLCADHNLLRSYRDFLLLQVYDRQQQLNSRAAAKKNASSAVFDSASQFVPSLGFGLDSASAVASSGAIAVSVESSVAEVIPPSGVEADVVRAASDSSPS